MIPAPFDYLRAGSADEAVAALSEHGDEAKLWPAGCRCCRCTEPPGDLNATHEYREHLARVLVRRAFEVASR